MFVGAIGGLTHHPIKSVLEKGPCTTGVIGGVGRGVLGAVAKPIGGVAELISMTGQGVLLATGWKPKPKVSMTLFCILHEFIVFHTIGIDLCTYVCFL